eukprot:COSAG02_NODE_4353_length_5461_cov_3.183141_3_plen_66_part_00
MSADVGLVNWEMDRVFRIAVKHWRFGAHSVAVFCAGCDKGTVSHFGAMGRTDPFAAQAQQGQFQY